MKPLTCSAIRTCCLSQHRIWLAGGLLALLLGAGPASAQGSDTAEEGRPSYSIAGSSDPDSPDAPLDRRTAEIRVRLPARAELWVNGKKTKLTGAVREFVTPRLDPEHVYTYVLRARWLEDGMTVEKTLRVRTFAGSRVTVNFVRRPAAAPLPPTVVRAEPPSGMALPPAEVEHKPVEWSAPTP